MCIKKIKISKNKTAKIKKNNLITKLINIFIEKIHKSNLQIVLVNKEDLNKVNLLNSNENFNFLRKVETNNEQVKKILCTHNNACTNTLTQNLTINSECDSKNNQSTTLNNRSITQNNSNTNTENKKRNHNTIPSPLNVNSTLNKKLNNTSHTQNSIIVETHNPKKMKKRLQRNDKNTFNFKNNGLNSKPVLIMKVHKNDFISEEKFEQYTEKFIGNDEYVYEYYSETVYLYVHQKINVDELIKTKNFFPGKPKRNLNAINEGPSIVIHEVPYDITSEIKDQLQNNGIIKILNEQSQGENKPKRFKPDSKTIKAICENERTRLNLLKNGIIINSKKLTTDINLKSFKQCEKCKDYGHIDIGCRRSEYCGDCGRKHKDCNTSQNRYCINCNKRGHGVYFKQCPKYIEHLEEIRQKEWKYLITSVEHELKEENTILDDDTKTFFEICKTKFMPQNKQNKMCTPNNFQTNLQAHSNNPTSTTQTTNNNLTFEQISDLISKQSTNIATKITESTNTATSNYTKLESNINEFKQQSSAQIESIKDEFNKKINDAEKRIETKITSETDHKINKVNDHFNKKLNEYQTRQFIQLHKFNEQLTKFQENIKSINEQQAKIQNDIQTRKPQNITSSEPTKKNNSKTTTKPIYDANGRKIATIPKSATPTNALKSIANILQPSNNIDSSAGLANKIHDEAMDYSINEFNENINSPFSNSQIINNTIGWEQDQTSNNNERFTNTKIANIVHQSNYLLDELTTSTQIGHAVTKFANQNQALYLKNSGGLNVEAAQINQP
jgi:hypothetical protein